LVFVTIAGFFGSFAILNDPSIGVFAAGDPAAVSHGVAIYMVCWGVLVFLFLLGSLRTNVVFILLFFTLDICLFLLSAAYFRMGDGNNGTKLMKAGGAFGFTTCLCGWYILLARVLGSTGIPLHIPLGDLSGFLAGKKTR